MGLWICLGALAALIYLAYRGFSVILVAPLVAMTAVLLTDPGAVAPAFSGLFMDKLATFVKLYFPVFLLGAIFGKLIEVSGAARSIVAGITRIMGAERAILAIAVVGMILTYGGVSVFVVVFATYPFAAEMFRRADIPKRLVPATIAFSAFTITMDALPGSLRSVIRLSVDFLVNLSVTHCHKWSAYRSGPIDAIVHALSRAVESALGRSCKTGIAVELRDAEAALKRKSVEHGSVVVRRWRCSSTLAQEFTRCPASLTVPAYVSPVDSIAV
jgi:hypothetical protein